MAPAYPPAPGSAPGSVSGSISGSAPRSAPESAAEISAEAHDDRWAIRRHGDRCFHAAEEFVPAQGYIVGGVLVPLDEIADVVAQQRRPSCSPLSLSDADVCGTQLPGNPRTP